LEGLCSPVIVSLALLLVVLHRTYRLTPGKEYGDKAPQTGPPRNGAPTKAT
jgi:hypothetical protein